MKGLKGHASDKFICFFELIQQTALQQGKVFFAFAGEDRIFSTPSMEGEDMSGWLVPKAISDRFEADWSAYKRVIEMEQWADFFTFAIWERNGENISVTFKQYD